MHLPEQHWDCTLDQVSPDLSYVPTIQTYIDNIGENLDKGRGLLLFGPHSSGKSALAAIALKAALVKTKHLGLWIRGSHVAGHKIEEDLYDADTTMYERCLEVELLVMDELILRGTSKAENFVEELIRERVDTCGAMIITTNLTPKQVKDTHPGIAEVLLEAVEPVKIEGTNFRKKIKDGWSGP
jgi:DNA replication protein DnaC